MKNAAWIIVLTFAALVVFSVTAAVFAADISPEYEKTPKNQRGVLWETVTQADTTAVAIWNGGCGLMEVTGTQNNADFELQWGSQSGTQQDVDSDSIPDGVRFSSATGLGMVAFALPAGYADIKFSSAGSSGQDLDIRLIPMDCP